LGWQCKGEGNVAFEPPFKPTSEVCFSSANSTYFDSFLGEHLPIFYKIEKEKTLVAILD
jgi:hypothetical protein